MKMTDITGKKTAELRAQRDKLREKIVGGLLDLRTKEVKNVRELRGLKRDVARLNTVIQARALSGEEQ